MKTLLLFSLAAICGAAALANDLDFERYDYGSPLPASKETQPSRMVYVPTQFYQTEDSTIYYGYKAFAPLRVLTQNRAAAPRVPESACIVAPDNLSAKIISGWKKVLPGNAASEMKTANRNSGRVGENELPPIAELVPGIRMDAAADGENRPLKTGRNQQLMKLDDQLEMEPDNAQAHYARASLLQEMREFSRAIADYDLAIKLDPKNAAAFYKRGLCRTATGRSDLAIDDFRMANRLSQENNRPWSLQSGEWIRQHGY